MPPACVFHPHLSCTSPIPSPCLAFGHVGLLRGKAEGSPSLATLHDPLSPPRPLECAAPAAAGQRGLRAVDTWGDKEGSEGALGPLLLPAMPSSHLPGPLGVTLMPLETMMALCMGIAGHLGMKPFLLLPLLPMEVPRTEG